MANFNNTLSSLNAYLAKGESCRQTNGLPDGGRTFNWSDRIAAKSRDRRVSKTPARK